MSVELQLSEVRARRGSVEVLHGISMSFARSSITALIGANGAGKSTTLSVLAGLIPTSSGVVRWQGRDLKGTTAYQRTMAGMMLVPERRGIFINLSVRDNLEVFARATMREQGAFDDALDAFPVLGERLSQVAGSLSGGEQQMLAMSRVLLQKPSVLLLDEISFGLAPQITARLLEVVAELARQQVTVVLVEQRMAEALRLADVVYVMSRGEVVFAGEPSELHEDQRFGVVASAATVTRRT